MPTASAPDAREWVRTIEESIRSALEGRSSLVPHVLAVPGMTSPRVKHFLNNLCRGEHVVYLEVGSWQGATATAASCRNPGRFTAVENFSQGGKDEFQANRRATAEWCRFGFVEGDCWLTPAEQIAEAASVNVYLYDGPHDYESQVRAFTHFDTLLAREFVAVVDDWDHPPVRKGTRVAFDTLNYEVVREWELPARFNGDTDNWWNGLYVGVVRKTAPILRPGSPTSLRTAPDLLVPQPVSTGAEASNRKTNSGGALPSPRSAGTRFPSVAIVIPCHNYAHWLGEAIDSALGQTRPAAEILVVDDSSTDRTPDVAKAYASRGVRYRRIQARSVWQARRAGFEATAADVLCFLDADDRLAPDYLERGLPLFETNRIGIVYSDFEQFGRTRARSDHAPFDRTSLEVENFMHTGSLVRRRALEVARAFDASQPVNSHADWYLWRRVCEAGFTAVKQPSLYFYRRHDESMILQAAKDRVSHYEFADLRHQPVTIVCPLSGRTWAWGRYSDWLERQTWPRGQSSLLIVDSGPTPGIREWTSTCGYNDVRYLAFDAGRPGLADLPRAANANEVRLAVSRIYNRVARAVETPFVFILEDDVIPPPDVIDRLMRSMTKKTAAVTAAYPSRFVSGNVAWREPGRHLEGGEGVEEIGGCGFGCLLIRRAAIETETFASLPGEHPDYDIAFFMRLRAAGWRVKIDWGVKAEHLSPPTVPDRIEPIRTGHAVSVIIAARDNGPYLRDAIQSALHQSVQPFEIIYADDGSTDDSVTIARTYPQVKVLARPHAGVCEARNRACREARGDYILHLDGDDIFPHGYIQQRLAVARANPHAAFVFGAAQAFGGEWNFYWDAPDWSLERLWNGNYVNTSTLIRRDAFEQVGMWRETFGTAWDWDLALRLGKAGFRGVRDPKAFLLYRHHPRSTSRQVNIKDLTSDAEENRMKYLVRVFNCRCTIATIVSGRVPELFEPWLEAVQRNIRYHADRIRGKALFAPTVTLEAPAPRLAVLYTGPKRGLARITETLRDKTGFATVSVIHNEWSNVYKTESERRDNVAQFLARSYNQILGDGELTWLLEDDVIPPDHAYDELAKAVLGAPRPLYAASGAYRNRHDPAHYVAQRWDGNDVAKIQELATLPDRPTFVDMTGTGCLLIFRPFARHAFGSHVKGIPAHDWRWCLDLKAYSEDYHPEAKQVLLLPHVACRHYRDAIHFV
ncbi:MAG: glycosyltransferase [Isosphaeraceae bacterium]|nr:glycosyltransferase [Isosphaeraceae bacterium]